jgi:hypothetical protein
MWSCIHPGHLLVVIIPFPVKWCHRRNKCTYDVTIFRKINIFALTNVPDESRIAVIVKGPIFPFIFHKCITCLKYDSLNTYPTPFQYSMDQIKCLMSFLGCQICISNRYTGKVWREFEGKIWPCKHIFVLQRGLGGPDHMVVALISIYAVSAYHYLDLWVWLMSMLGFTQYKLMWYL